MRCRRLLAVFAGLVAVVGPERALESAALDLHDNFDRVVKQAWKTEHGLPQSTVTSIEQSNDGYIWVGTFGGVARFDGVRFTIFDAGNTPGILNNRVTALLEDRERILWVGTEGGLSRREHGRWSTLTKTDGLPHANITSLAQDADGVVWAGTVSGLAAIRDGHAVSGAWDGLSKGVPSRVAPGRRGDIWAVAGRKLFRITHGKAVEVPYAIDHGLTLPTSMFEDRDRALWVGFQDVTWRRHANGRWSVLLDIRGSGLRLSSTSITETDSGQVVFVSGQEIFWWRNGELTAREGVAPGVNDDLRVVRYDRDGGLWIGTDRQGLEVWRRPRVTALGAADGFQTGSVVPVLADRMGRIWTAAPCDGIRAVPVRPSGARPITLERPACVWALAEDPSGDIWAGSFGGGLHRIRNGRIVARYTTAHGLVDNGIYALFIDRSGTLWIGTYRGVSTYRAGRFATVPLTAEDTSFGVHFITQDRAGAMWIAARGVIRIAGKEIQRFDTTSGLSNNAVRVIYQDRDDALWIGTYGGGLNRLKDGSRRSRRAMASWTTPCRW
jgi:ligand-binding sensor domain-containing protein